MRDFFRLSRYDIPFIVAALFLFFLTAFARGAEMPPCPAPPPNTPLGCKWLSISPAEEQSLTGTGNILDAAEWARRMELNNTITYWRQKLRDAPAGTSPEPAK